MKSDISYKLQLLCYYCYYYQENIVVQYALFLLWQLLLVMWSTVYCILSWWYFHCVFKWMNRCGSFGYGTAHPTVTATSAKFKTTTFIALLQMNWYCMHVHIIQHINHHHHAWLWSEETAWKPVAISFLSLCEKQMWTETTQPLVKFDVNDYLLKWTWQSPKVCAGTTLSPLQVSY